MPKDFHPSRGALSARGTFMDRRAHHAAHVMTMATAMTPILVTEDAYATKVIPLRVDALSATTVGISIQ